MPSSWSGRYLRKVQIYWDQVPNRNFIRNLMGKHIHTKLACYEWSKRGFFIMWKFRWPWGATFMCGKSSIHRVIAIYSENSLIWSLYFGFWAGWGYFDQPIGNFTLRYTIIRYTMSSVCVSMSCSLCKSPCWSLYGASGTPDAETSRLPEWWYTRQKFVKFSYLLREHEKSHFAYRTHPVCHGVKWVDSCRRRRCHGFDAFARNYSQGRHWRQSVPVPRAASASSLAPWRPGAARRRRHSARCGKCRRVHAVRLGPWKTR